MKRILVGLLLSTFLFACKDAEKKVANNNDINKIAAQYIHLGLTIGQYDGDFVDAYYGPDSLKPAPKDSLQMAVFPKDSLLKAVTDLQNALQPFISSPGNDSMKNRANWMSNQLRAFTRRIKIVAGESMPFDEESKELFGVAAPVYDETHFKNIIAELDKILPGSGDLPARMKTLSDKFIIPKNKIDTVFKTAIAEARKRTLAHYPLPAEENFKLEYVTNKPWSGYNWYKGNYQSVIQINTDLPIMIDRAIDLACHEGYPGHHVYNMLLEKNLYKQKGWVEISLYPLFSPQSLIAEGSANYGIEVAFPGNEQMLFAKEVLMPLAGLDTTGAAAYFKLLVLKKQLNYARNEAARKFLADPSGEKEAMRWLMSYALFGEEAAKKSLSFIKKYRSYVINYNYGQDMVKNYIEKRGGTAENVTKRWELFGWLLSNQVATTDLLQ